MDIVNILRKKEFLFLSIGLATLCGKGEVDGGHLDEPEPHHEQCVGGDEGASRGG